MRRPVLDNPHSQRCVGTQRSRLRSLLINHLKQPTHNVGTETAHKTNRAYSYPAQPLYIFQSGRSTNFTSHDLPRIKVQSCILGSCRLGERFRPPRPAFHRQPRNVSSVTNCYNLTSSLRTAIVGSATNLLTICDTTPNPGLQEHAAASGHGREQSHQNDRFAHRIQRLAGIDQALEGQPRRCQFGSRTRRLNNGPPLVAGRRSLLVRRGYPAPCPLELPVLSTCGPRICEFEIIL